MASVRSAVVIAGILIVVGLSACADSSNPTTAASGTAPTVAPKSFDATLLYGSVVDSFLSRYKTVTGDSTAELSRRGGTYCDEDGASFSCLMQVKLLLGVTENWAYKVTPSDKPECWTAKTRKTFGAYQDDVDAYRNDEFLAPSRKDANKQVRDARRLRHLDGCLKAALESTTGDPSEQLVASFASDGVKQAFPGKQTSTSCKYKGKQEIALAPDSYDFKCVTKLASDRRYVDLILCFDPPPLKNLDSCTEEEGYPRKPPRPVP